MTYIVMISICGGVALDLNPLPPTAAALRRGAATCVPHANTHRVAAR